MPLGGLGRYAAFNALRRQSLGAAAYQRDDPRYWDALGIGPIAGTVGVGGRGASPAGSPGSDVGPLGLPWSGSEPPPDTTSGFETVSNENINWSRRPTAPGSTGARTSIPSFNYNPLVWNPGMQIGATNIFGGQYQGLVYGPNQGGGSGYHTAFTAGGRGISGLSGLRGGASFGNIGGSGRISFNRVLPNGQVVSTGSGGGGLGNAPPNLQGQRNL